MSRSGPLAGKWNKRNCKWRYEEYNTSLIRKQPPVLLNEGGACHRFGVLRNARDSPSTLAGDLGAIVLVLLLLPVLALLLALAFLPLLLLLLAVALAVLRITSSKRLQKLRFSVRGQIADPQKQTWNVCLLRRRWRRAHSKQEPSVFPTAHARAAAGTLPLLVAFAWRLLLALALAVPWRQGACSRAC